MTLAATRMLQEHCPAARAIKRWPAKNPVVRRELVLNGICPNCGADAPQGVTADHRGEARSLPMHCWSCGWREQRP